MTTILAIDTATDACSATLLSGRHVAAHQSVEMERGQAEALIPMIVEVVDLAGAAFDDLSAVAVTIGPGAFTGLRIGLAAARGIGLAAGIPVIGLTTLETIAAAVPASERNDATIAAVVESKRSDIYLQSFDASLVPLGPPASVMPDALPAALPAGTVVFAGTAAQRAYQALDDPGRIRLSVSWPHPDTRVLASIAAGRLQEANAAGNPIKPPEPLYLRPPDAKLPSGGGRLRP